MGEVHLRVRRSDSSVKVRKCGFPVLPHLRRVEPCCMRITASMGDREGPGTLEELELSAIPFSFFPVFPVFPFLRSLC